MASPPSHGEPSLALEDSDLEPRDKWIELGRGAFSVVYKAFSPLHNVHVAVKEIRRGDDLREIKKLVTLSAHDHIVRIKAVLEKPDGKSGIIMEFCEYGSLQSLRDTLGSNFIPWPRCLNFMQHIMSGLEFLHRNEITHRDLKPENVMVTKSFTCKIADVGLSKAYASHSSSASNTEILCPTGTPFYISPQRWREPAAVGTQTDDIYSCGILFYKMITNADLFYMERMRRDDSFFTLLKRYVADNNNRPKIEKLDDGTTPAPVVVKDVIKTCWHEDAEERKTFNYWASLLREEIKNSYSDEMIEKADEELRHLLKKPDETDSPANNSLPSLQPLQSVEEGRENLTTQENAGDSNIIRDDMIINPESLVTDQDLNTITDEIGPEWQRVGLSLGLSKVELFHCDADNPYSVQDKIFDMLHKWKKKEKLNAKRKVLVKLLAGLHYVDQSAYGFMLKR